MTKTVSETGGGDASATARSPEEKAADKRISRLLARGLFDQAWSADHPEASRKDRRAAFKAEIKSYTRAGRKLRLFLERQGLQMTPGEKPKRAKKAAPAESQAD